MLIRTVPLNSAGHPYIKVKVYGLSPQFAKEFDALIDTGFTGFMMLPLTAALPLGLTLLSTASYTLADGSQSSSLIALGTVVYDGQEVHGPISLEMNASCDDALLGMDYIRQSKQMLVLSSEAAALIDMPGLAQQMAAQIKSNASVEEPSPASAPYETLRPEDKLDT